MPNKFLSEHDALIGVGSVFLDKLAVGKTLSTLWDETKDISNIGNFERFILGLDLLFILGLIEVKIDKIIKVI
ncbi:ABC-three component system middle component 6 [uncultured Legionella sp.]|uniref:ABC-three component system middle component 6 n=1 Tax=uncultured Legionella sp. TaxID=210934 RepID=UPI00260C9141|nr:ABC-three component system middle component 6 [uncultured Legionella sp.]